MMKTKISKQFDGSHQLSDFLRVAMAALLVMIAIVAVINLLSVVKQMMFD